MTIVTFPANVIPQSRTNVQTLVIVVLVVIIVVNAAGGYVIAGALLYSLWRRTGL